MTNAVFLSISGRKTEKPFEKRERLQWQLYHSTIGVKKKHQRTCQGRDEDLKARIIQEQERRSVRV